MCACKVGRCERSCTISVLQPAKSAIPCGRAGVWVGGKTSVAQLEIECERRCNERQREGILLSSPSLLAHALVDQERRPSARWWTGKKSKSNSLNPSYQTTSVPAPPAMRARTITPTFSTKYPPGTSRPPPTWTVLRLVSTTIPHILFL
jgi:hypothetical protein